MKKKKKKMEYDRGGNHTRKLMHMLNAPTATHCQAALKIAMIVVYFS